MSPFARLSRSTFSGGDSRWQNLADASFHGFLLSDGVPTSGTIRDPELLLQYVAERNRVLRLRIHCLSLTDEASSRDFLQRLAALTGGQYVELVRAGP